MKTLIVDDEPIAHRVLREQLDMFSKSKSLERRKMAGTRYSKSLTPRPTWYSSISDAVMGGFRSGSEIERRARSIIVIVLL